MKADLTKENLTKALSTCMRAVSLKASLPILANICFNTEGPKMKFSATNLELGVNYWSEAKTLEEGSISVPARILLEYISSLDVSQISLESKDETLLITSDQGEATIAGISSQEFPPVPTLTEQANIFLDPNEFQKAVAQVAFAASTDASRVVLSGVLLHFSPEALLLVATDGYRLAQKKWDRETGTEQSVIIPAKSLYEISRIVSEAALEGEELKIFLNKEKNQAIFGLDKVHMTTRLLDGNYPNYTQIIPTSFVSRAVVEADKLGKAVRTVSVFARDSGSVIKADFSSSTLALSAQTTQVGDTKTSLPISFEGEPMSVAFNQRFLQEALSAISSTQVSLEMTSPTSPIVVRGVGNESYLHLIMPVRLQG
ncbi:MAG: DNA polymerase III subunit beta [Candidatus Woykebacteria bacterium RIFCSPHIGHO2_12_FULL_43_10]|uniref:Beta sliding clamp n=2 Tax=Candidatus Woykeibacteriota TaxID=1817899 RepID=A0A1G1WTH1_9BACT|nr:MAG: DNA polymerase III subunit beta [Candidatus Woykebacteria bacterium RIFCSPHIGHO2_01_FULL_43_29]OGY28325.1 MAG: DNA polymerase III subunit beta [Candidatus Woykebacteria bacterium RIFCSPHIGHO2_02_FULL_43_16b]OGY28888.1 MAG: DNA polymerase III subunit beta [Candidatus Woykebacteria bacterium RIFCSPHIGHO2_12_FULL_43_10]OGY30620.1 MAG: DNA polymerase III subunit beta [Candidatus Woykebacteria bacterium RIFCSPLOWO2_01_FULL_43_14]